MTTGNKAAPRTLSVQSIMLEPDPRAQIISLLPRLRRFASGLTHDGHMADDLVQAACLKALERWHQYQTDTSLASWMFRIVQTTWLDDYRTRQRHKTDTDTDALPDIEGEDGRQVVERRSDLRAVRTALAGLPEDQRAVLMLITVDGLSYQETALALDIPMGTVMSRLSRARIRLANALGRQGA
jgi:RNA polymerase sigma-70 factor, ECF subfamily